MNSQITFSGAHGNVKYLEAGQQGHGNLSHAVNRSEGNGLTVKTACCCRPSQNNSSVVLREYRERERGGLVDEGGRMLKTPLILAQGYFKCKEVQTRKYSLWPNCFHLIISSN